MQWDLFCRVVDNLGDIGVCWRLAADLAARGEQVRLWVDDPSALAWMAPAGAERVTVQAWQGDTIGAEPGDVVIEAFGCDPPPAFVAAMRSRQPSPRWINLEYLSAEGVVERNHRLTSPQSTGPGRGLVKHFFYPGFTPRTGGLMREPDLAARQQAFDRSAWMHGRGLGCGDEDTVVSLFCYANTSVPALLDALAGQPTLLLVTPGPAAAQVRAALGPSLRRGALRAELLPWLSQAEYDHLLWASDLNLVRGEDSFVRAQWAGQPFVWQIYPQADGVHRVKLEAFLDRHLAAASPALAAALRGLWARWNGFSDADLSLPALPPWRDHVRRWRGTLHAQPDLAAQLLGFVAETR